MKSYCLLILLILYFTPSNSQVTGLYGIDTTQGLANYDYVNSLTEGPNGNVWFTGRLEKTLNTSGGMVFEYGSVVEVGSAGNILTSFKSGFKKIRSFAVTADNNFLAGGEGSGFMCTSGMCKSDMLVAKITSAGSTIWGRSFGNPNYNGSDGLRSVIETANGDVVVVGNVYQSSSHSHPFVARLNGMTGDTVWTKVIGFPTNQFGNHVSEGPGGELFIGITGNLRLAKLTSSGSVTWVKNFAAYGEVVKVNAQPDGSVIAAGHYLAATGNYNICLFKVSATGALEWFRDYNTALPDHYEMVTDMVQQNDGIYLSGWHYSMVNFTGNMPLVMKLDVSDGDLLWARSWPTPVGEARALLYKDGNILTGIDYNTSIQNKPDVLIQAIDSTGDSNCFITHPVTADAPVITPATSAAYYYGDYETQVTMVSFSYQQYWRQQFCASVPTVINETDDGIWNVVQSDGWIEISTNENFNFILLDITGRILTTGTGNHSASIDVSHFSKQAVMLKLFSDQKSYIKKVILE